MQLLLKGETKCFRSDWRSTFIYEYIIMPFLSLQNKKYILFMLLIVYDLKERQIFYNNLIKIQHWIIKQTSKWNIFPQLETQASSNVAAWTCTWGSGCARRRITARRQSREFVALAPARSQISRIRPHSSLVLFSLVARSAKVSLIFIILFHNHSYIINRKGINSF